MKILYFYQYFSTPKGSWGTRVYEFAKDWVVKGHEVTVVTSIYSKSDLKAQQLIETQVLKAYPADTQCAESEDLPAADQNKPDPINNVPMVSSSRSVREKITRPGKEIWRT